MRLFNLQFRFSVSIILCGLLLIQLAVFLLPPKGIEPDLKMLRFLQATEVIQQSRRDLLLLLCPVVKGE